MGYYKIFTQEMCAKLMLKGFVLQGIEKDSRNEKFNLFLFRDSANLRDTVNKIKRGE